MKILLLVDVQKDMINSNNEFVLDNILHLTQTIRFDKIFATLFKNRENSQYDNWLNYTKFNNSSIDDLLLNDKLKIDKVFTKTSYSILDSDLASNFSPNDEVYICGTDYDACILAIAYQMFDHNIRPFIVIDCVGSHSSNPLSKQEFEKLCVKDFGKKSIVRF